MGPDLLLDEAKLAIKQLIEGKASCPNQYIPNSSDNRIMRKLDGSQ